MIDDPQQPVVYIVRRGHGRLEVHPSPVRVPEGGLLVVRNLLSRERGETAVVDFHREKDAATADPPRQEVAAGASATFRITVAGPTFVEYQIRLTTGEWVVGGSSPGMIVDG